MNLKEIKDKRFKDEEGTSNYMNVSIEEMDWVFDRAELFEKLLSAYRTYDGKETQEERNQYFDEFRRILIEHHMEKKEFGSGVYDERVGFVTYDEIEETVAQIYDHEFKIGDVVKHKDAAYSESFTIVGTTTNGHYLFIQGPKPKYSKSFPASKSQLFKP